MKSRRWAFAILCCGILVCCLGSPAFAGPSRGARTQKKETAEVTVVGADPDAEQVQTTLSGTVAVTLRVEGSTKLEVEPIQALTASETWKERRRQPPKEKQELERKIWEQQFTLEPQRAGDVALVLTPLRFRDNPNDSWTTIAWDPIPVKVTTEITQADPKELRDITPPEPVSQPEGNGYLWLMWAGGGLIVVALAVGAWELRRRASDGQTPAIAPDRWAVKQLDKIRKMDLNEDGGGIKQHALVSDVLRRYMELRYRLKAPGKTTGEFLDSMRQGGHLSTPQFANLRDALERCDLAKFARVSPSREECLELDRNVQTLVAETARAGAP
jgi:hypothetical protein